MGGENLGQIYAEVVLDVAKLKKGKAEVEASLKEMGIDVNNAKAAFNSLSASVGSALSLGVTLPLTLLARQSVKTFAAFEQSLANVASVSGATAGEFERIRKSAEEAGATTRFTASQAADALYYLSSAGLDASQSVAALGGVLELAGATASDLSYTAETVTSTLSQFNLSASDSGRVSNVFAAAISKSQATMNKLADSMRYVGPVAAGFGMSMEETTAALMALYNAGFKGEQAGTILRKAFSDLANPVGSAKDIIEQYGLSLDRLSPEMNDFADIIDYLSEKGITSADALRLFGAEAGPGMITLLRGGGTAIRNYQAAITDTAAATEMYAKQNDTLAGDQDMLKSAMENLSIVMTRSFEPMLRSITQGLTSITSAIAGLPAPVRIASVAIMGFAAGAGPVMALVGSIDKLKTALMVLQAFAAQNPLLLGIMAAATAIVTTMTIIKNAQAEVERRNNALVEQAARIAESYNEEKDAARDLANQIQELSNKTGRTVGEQRRLEGLIAELQMKFPGLTHEVIEQALAYGNLADEVERLNREKAVEELSASKKPLVDAKIKELEQLWTFQRQADLANARARDGTRADYEIKQLHDTAAQYEDAVEKRQAVIIDLQDKIDKIDQMIASFDAKTLETANPPPPPGGPGGTPSSEIEQGERLRQLDDQYKQELRLADLTGEEKARIEEQWYSARTNLLKEFVKENIESGKNYEQSIAAYISGGSGTIEAEIKTTAARLAELVRLREQSYGGGLLPPGDGGSPGPSPFESMTEEQRLLQEALEKTQADLDAVRAAYTEAMEAAEKNFDESMRAADEAYAASLASRSESDRQMYQAIIDSLDEQILSLQKALGRQKAADPIPTPPGSDDKDDEKKNRSEYLRLLDEQYARELAIADLTGEDKAKIEEQWYNARLKLLKDFVSKDIEINKMSIEQSLASALDNELGTIETQISKTAGQLAALGTSTASSLFSGFLDEYNRGIKEVASRLEKGMISEEDQATAISRLQNTFLSAASTLDFATLTAEQVEAFRQIKDEFFAKPSEPSMFEAMVADQEKLKESLRSTKAALVQAEKAYTDALATGETSNAQSYGAIIDALKKRIEQLEDALGMKGVDGAQSLLKGLNAANQYTQIATNIANAVREGAVNGWENADLAGMAADLTPSLGAGLGAIIGAIIPGVGASLGMQIGRTFGDILSGAISIASMMADIFDPTAAEKAKTWASTVGAESGAEMTDRLMQEFRDTFPDELMEIGSSMVDSISSGFASGDWNGMKGILEGQLREFVVQKVLASQGFSGQIQEMINDMLGGIGTSGREQFDAKQNEIDFAKAEQEKFRAGAQRFDQYATEIVKKQKEIEDNNGFWHPIKENQLKKELAALQEAQKQFERDAVFFKDWNNQVLKLQAELKNIDPSLGNEIDFSNLDPSKIQELIDTYGDRIRPLLENLGLMPSEIDEVATSFTGNLESALMSAVEANDFGSFQKSISDSMKKALLENIKSMTWYQDKMKSITAEYKTAMLDGIMGESEASTIRDMYKALFEQVQSAVDFSGIETLTNNGTVTVEQEVKGVQLTRLTGTDRDYFAELFKSFAYSVESVMASKEFTGYMDFANAEIAQISATQIIINSVTVHNGVVNITAADGADLRGVIAEMIAEAQP